jgi:hypothetical protein
VKLVAARGSIYFIGYVLTGGTTRRGRERTCTLLRVPDAGDLIYAHCCKLFTVAVPGCTREFQLDGSKYGKAETVPTWDMACELGIL